MILVNAANWLPLPPANSTNTMPFINPMIEYRVAVTHNKWAQVPEEQLTKIYILEPRPAALAAPVGYS